MKAYSADLRQRVLADCDAGLGTKAVAEKYRVSPAIVRRWKQRRRETGELHPRRGGGARPRVRFGNLRLTTPGICGILIPCYTSERVR